MLYKETTTPFLLTTLKDLMLWDELQNFRLVGGTGLSLQLGHRKSVDIDLFSDKAFDKTILSKRIRKKFPRADIQIQAFGIAVYLDHKTDALLKIDFMETDPFIRPAVSIDNIKLAHIEDIAGMKLEAIISRNTKKDFYDIAELLNHYNLEDLLSFYKEKYPYNDIKQVLENITFFSEDCETDFDPVTIKDIDWLTVKFKITDAFNDFAAKILKQ